MNLRNYMILSSLMFANLLIFTFIVFSITDKIYFLTGLFSLTILTAIGITAAYSIYHEKKYAYTITAIFFALSLVETAILYFAITSYLIILLVLISVFGFIISIDDFVFSQSKKIQPPKAPLTKWVNIEDKQEKTQTPLKSIEVFEKEIEQKESLKREIPSMTFVKKPKREPRIIFKDDQEETETNLESIQKIFQPYFDEIKKEEKENKSIEKPAKKLSDHDWAEKEWTALRNKFMHLPEKTTTVKVSEGTIDTSKYYDEMLPENIIVLENKKIIPIKKTVKKKAVRKIPVVKKTTKRIIVKRILPGKYVASEFGKAYHLPKCEWAKKIPRANRVWYKTRSRAEKEGYDKHNCVK